MPFTFLIVGAFLLAAGANGKGADLFALLKGDFVNAPGVQQQATFVPWAAAILILGAAGYVPALRVASRLFLVLVILVLFLSNQGFFAQLQQQFPELFPKAATA